MATLTRPKVAPKPATTPSLASAIPTPFPRELLQQQVPPLEPSTQLNSPPQIEAGTSQVSETSNAQELPNSGVFHELMPSIAYVQKSCLMTLNNLLHAPTRWNPIVPDRRHSMPSTPQASTAHQADVESSSSALQTLVSNLRNRDTNSHIIESRTSSSDSELIRELRKRIEGISSSLEPEDAHLATAIVSLLSHFTRLSVIQTTSSDALGATTVVDSSALHESDAPTDPFDTLKRQLSDFQVEHLSSQHQILGPNATPILTTEATLLWSRIDEELETVVAMCKERTEGLPRFSLDHFPPQYDAADYNFDNPPEYESGVRTSVDDKSQLTNEHQLPATTSGQANEKMRLDLEAVTMAIDRLYLVAPQLHNQRVELKSSKLAQMEKARREGTTSRSVSLGKQKEEDPREMQMFELLHKASERSLKDQSVVLEGGMQRRFEKSRLRDNAKREAFVEQLAEHSDAGRFHGQDAILHSRKRMKDPETLLSLPEFIREAMPITRPENPTALLTLPEFVNELPNVERTAELDHEVPPIPVIKARKKNRHRSLSAPSLSWLRSSSRSTSSSDIAAHARANFMPGLGFEVNYVAENHENLQHVLVFLRVSGATAGVDLEAEVVPSYPGNSGEGSHQLVISSGPHTSLPLTLPALTLPGMKEVKVQSGHYEIKVPTIACSSSSSSSEDSIPLLDASQLSLSSPTSFICASCSLPLVQSSKINLYRDLPSEHWEELVDAWMCHTDQKLHANVMSHGKGAFWPQQGQALVGGSYILFEESSLAKNNLHHAEETKRGEDWRLVRCLCGAVIGRCQEHRSDDGVNPIVYRLLKYAIRPVSPTSEPLSIPLSAFIVEDMIEFVQAHATYRFVILDEEDERPRMLIWLFKPSIRLAYSISAPYAISKSASIHAAKVLYKILGPSAVSTDLKSIVNSYPGFPQAEYLFYPMNICRRLAGLLAESNNSYPESMRTMTGLNVGWLHRA